MSGWMLYFFFQLDTIRGCGFSAGCLLVAVAMIITIVTAYYASEEREEWIPIVKKAKPWRHAILGVVLIMLTGFVPKTEEMAVIYVVPKVINSQSAQEIPKKLLQLSNEWLEELRPKIKEVDKTSSNKQNIQSVEKPD